MKQTTLVPAAITLALLAMACTTPDPESEAPASLALDVPAAAVRVAALPEGFEVVTNDADSFRLTAPGEAGGAIVVALGDRVEQGINIITAVEDQLEEFEAQPGGESHGQTQLQAPIGLAYMARGRYESDGQPVEELRALLVHPWGNRLLTISYVYPAGTDTQQRGGHLMELLGEMEALEQPVDADSQESMQ